MERLVKKFAWWSMLVSSVLVASFALFAYVALPLGAAVHPDMRSVFEENRIFIYTHIFGSLVALMIGPLQFSTNLRLKHIQFHRWSGRVYLFVGVLFGGVAGFIMAQHTSSGLVSRVGFTSSAVVWIFTGSMALYSILKRDVDAHRRWMVRNFSLTFSAVTLRIYLAIFMASGVPFAEFYPLLAWLSWVPNILLAEWAFNTHNKASHRIKPMSVASGV
jgi:hypothetical protein